MPDEPSTPEICDRPGYAAVRRQPPSRASTPRTNARVRLATANRPTRAGAPGQDRAGAGLKGAQTNSHGSRPRAA